MGLNGPGPKMSYGKQNGAYLVKAELLGSYFRTLFTGHWKELATELERLTIWTMEHQHTSGTPANS